MRNFLTKEVKQAVLDIDQTGKAVKVAVASFDNIDLDGDVFDIRAFTKTISERGPSGSNQIWHLTNHHTSLSAALGKPKEIGVEGQFLYFVTDYKDTPLWQSIWPLYESGDITEHSVGFSIVDSEQKGNYRLIKEAMLWEGSAVLWGANPNTPTMQVVKDLAGIGDETDPLQMIEKLANLAKKSDNELIHIGLLQLYTKLQKETTKPPNSTLPDVDVTAVSLALTQFKNKLNLL
jgi:HK97 family phage prohead protease